MIQKTNIPATIENIPYFRGLSHAGKTELSGLFAPRRVAAGDTIFREGDPPTSLCLLESGKVKVYKHSPEGRSVLVEVIKPGQTFGEVAVYDGKPYPATAEAMTEATILCMERNAFLTFIDRHPQLAKAVIADLGSRLRFAKSLIRLLAVERAEKRLASVVLKLGKKLGLHSVSGLVIDLPLTRKELADMSGLTPETAIRIIGAWQKDGVVEFKRRRLTVKDPALLRSIAES